MDNQKNSFCLTDEKIDPRYAAQVAKALLPNVVSKINELNVMEVNQSVNLLAESLKAAFGAAGAIMIAGLMGALMAGGEAVGFLSMGAGAGKDILKTKDLNASEKGFSDNIEKFEQELKELNKTKNTFESAKMPKDSSVVAQTQAVSREENPEGKIAANKAEITAKEVDIKTAKAEKENINKQINLQTKDLQKVLNERQSIQFLAQMLGNMPKSIEDAAQKTAEADSQKTDAAYQALSSVQGQNQQTVGKVFDAVAATARAQIALAQGA